MTARVLPAVSQAESVLAATGPEVPNAHGRPPLWRIIDPAWYLQRYPDAAAQMAQSGISDVETFYWSEGAARGHAPNMFFDEGWYLASYPDIAAHVAAGGTRSGFEHYITHGHLGRSPHWLFDERGYRSLNRDITQAVLDQGGFVNGYDHYLARGDAEFRQSHLFFDALLYQQNVLESDAIRAWPGGPFRRFLAGGCEAADQARLSWYFDPAWYQDAYPELLAERDAGRWSCLLQHYLCNRTPQRYAAVRWFSEAFYGATYPDVLRAVADRSFRNGYDHFTRFGAAERRQPHEEVDLVAYYRSTRVQAEVERGDVRDAFAHWLAARELQDAQPAPAPILESQSKQLFARVSEASLLQFRATKLDFTVSGVAELSVIMVVHNQFALTMAALASLRAAYTGAIDLVLVDCGSRDDTVRIGRVIAGARIVRFSYNAGFVVGCNAALAETTAAVVLYLNNDLVLGVRAIDQGLARLHADASIGALGGKMIRTNGVLQEAGSIIWRDGSTAGYLRDSAPDAPEANFVRDVDFCSGAFLMVRGDVLRALGGFDEAFRPAYYEETDLCVRVRKAGYRVVYDPSVVVHHVEFGSSGHARSERMIRRNHAVFVERHRDWLRYKLPPRPRNALFARSPRGGKGRILFIEDRVPIRALGSGYVRSNDIVRAMVELGYEVSVYPIFHSTISVLETLSDFPETVEVLYDRGQEQLPAFIAERSGFYDLVWVGRTHNLKRLLPILADASSALPAHGFVLDTEAVCAPRVLEQARILGRPVGQDLDAMLRDEFACAYFCQKIVAVNERDAALIRSTGHGDVCVLGHVQEPMPTPSGWADRQGLLFLGAFHDSVSPNYDSIAWFVSEVLPLLDERLPPDVRFTIAGTVARSVDLSPFGRNRRVDLAGPVDDPSALYDTHRVFVAPTRFAGGIPFKLHEAAAYGLPIVATELLCQQVGWTDGRAVLSGGTDDAARFAEQIMELYLDAALWRATREEALRRIASETDRASYLRQLSGILEAAGAENQTPGPG